MDGGRCGGVAEAMRDQQAEVPVVVRVGHGVAGDQVRRGVHVPPLVGQPQVDLQVGPVVGQRIDDLGERVRQPARHRAAAY